MVCLVEHTQSGSELLTEQMTEQLILRAETTSRLSIDWQKNILQLSW